MAARSRGKKIEPKGKRDRFVELAPKRTQKALDAIRRVGNCSVRSAYEFTHEESEAIVTALEQAVEDVRTKFNDKRQRTYFELPI